MHFDIARLSSKGQFVIPEKVRKSLGLRTGTKLALFTDGIPEAWDASEEEYGDERLLSLLCSLRGKGAAAVRDAVLADLGAFVGEAHASDDVTLVLVRRCP